MDRTDLIQWGLIGLLLVGLVYVVFALPNKRQLHTFEELDEHSNWPERGWLRSMYVDVMRLRLLVQEPKKYWYKIEVDDGFKWKVGLYDSYRGEWGYQQIPNTHGGPFEDLYECIDDMNNYLANLQKPTIIQVSKNDLKLEGVVKL